VFSPDPKLGFLSHAQTLVGSPNPAASQLIFNDRLDAGLALFFMAVVVIVILASAREWVLIATKRKAPAVNEGPYVKSRLDPIAG
jgi:carbon starvation protein